MNILITRHDKIGDFITILPLLKIISSHTKHRVTVLVAPINYGLACHIDYIDDVIVYTPNSLQLVQEIRRHNFDVSISCFIDTRLAIALWLANIPRRIAPATKIAQLFFNDRVKQKRGTSGKTEWQYNIDLLTRLAPEINHNFTRPLLSFADVIPNQERVVAFHPGFGGSSDANLSWQHYLQLAKSIAGQQGIKVVFTFGPDDAMSRDYIAKHIDFPAELIDSKMSLVDFCKLLATFELFISTSTGPMQLAGALNIKTLSFFGNNRFAGANRWAPISDIEQQVNFSVPENYTQDFYQSVEHKLAAILKIS
jgi:ADP-heptose:LPS heptosyltransferase